jgi:hypothetical protein
MAGSIEALRGAGSVYELALRAARGARSLAELAAAATSDGRFDLAELEAAGMIGPRAL